MLGSKLARLADRKFRIATKDQTAELSCDFVIDASGHRRAIARSKTRTLRYDRLLSAAIAVCEPAHEDYRGDRLELALVEAVDSGWWYSAVTPSQRRLFVRFADADAPVVSTLRTPQGLIGEMRATKHVSAIADICDFSAVSTVTFATASSTRLQTVCAPDWAAIGDAARTVDPLSSHGIYNAIHDGVCIAHAVIERSTGRQEALDDYQQSHETNYEAYLSTKERVYASERRWPEHPFWALRFP